MIPSSPQVVHLLGEVESHKLVAVRQQEVLTSTGQRSQQDQETLQAGRAQLQALQEALQEAQAQLRKEVQRSKALEQEKERLEERVVQLRKAGETAGRGTRGADSQNVSQHSSSSPVCYSTGQFTDMSLNPCLIHLTCLCLVEWFP